MPAESDPERRHDDPATPDATEPDATEPDATEPDDDGTGEQDQREAAAELSGRAGESVRRRYDATQEVHYGRREREGDGDETGEPGEPEADSDEGDAGPI